VNQHLLIAASDFFNKINAKRSSAFGEVRILVLIVDSGR
jgi:hypothetical protein